MNSKVFAHVPLSTNGHYTRLVKIKTADEHGANKLQLDLAVRQFTDNIAYNAVSYEWGNAEAAAHIQINNQVVSIRQNLHDFLEILTQSVYKDEWLFIDAICIDQDNILERNAQVQRMGDIYRHAQVVLVWLGPATPESDAIFNMCETQVVSAEGDASAKISWEGEVGDALETIYQRSYWTRLWIIQELLLARSIVFFCGPKLTTWSVFRRLPRSVKGIFYEGGLTGMDIKLGSTPRGRHARSLLSALERRGSKEDQTEQQLYKLVVDFGKAKCLDNRDCVFGLLGLAGQDSTERQSLDVRADYSAEPSELFVRLLSNMPRELNIYAARDVFDILHLHTDLSVFTQDNQIVNKTSATISGLSLKSTLSILDILSICQPRHAIGVRSGKSAKKPERRTLKILYIKAARFTRFKPVNLRLRGQHTMLVLIMRCGPMTAVSRAKIPAYVKVTMCLCLWVQIWLSFSISRAKMICRVKRRSHLNWGTWRILGILIV